MQKLLIEFCAYFTHNAVHVCTDRLFYLSIHIVPFTKDDVIFQLYIF